MQDDSRDSVEADFGPFAVVPAALLSDTRVPDRAVRVWCAIARYANRRTGDAFPAQRTLAADLHTSVDTIQRAVRHLQSLGWLKVRARLSTDGTKRKLGNLYTVIYGNGTDAASVENGDRKSGGTETANSGSTKTAPDAASYIEEVTDHLGTDHLDRDAFRIPSKEESAAPPWTEDDDVTFDEWMHQREDAS